MEDSLENIFITLINSEFIIGILGNGFITLVNCTDEIKMQKVSLADQILTALAISRIGLILVMIVSLFTKESYPSSSLDIKGNKVILFSIAGLLANHFSVWLVTGLSLFYFLKIVNFSNAVFLHLKFRIGMVVMVMFLGIDFVELCRRKHREIFRKLTHFVTIADCKYSKLSIQTGK